MLTVLINRVDNIQECIGNISKIKILRVRENRLRWKHGSKNEECLMGSLLHWTWKDSLRMRTYQQKLPKLKSKDWKKGTEYSRTRNHYKKYKMCLMWIREGGNEQ